MWFGTVRWRYRQRRVWLIPTLIVAAAVLLAWLLPNLDMALADELSKLLPGEKVWRFDAGVMASVLSSVASGMIAFTGFVFTVVLLVIQFGTGSMSARLAPRLTQDRVLGAALGMFMATFVYTLLISVRLGTRIEDYEPVLSSMVAIGLALASVGLFFALLARVVNSLRLVKVLEKVARIGEKTIDEMHPQPYRDDGPGEALGTPQHVVHHSGRGGVLLGIDEQPVAELAARAGCRVTLVPAVGDFVLPGAPLFEIHGSGRIKERSLRRHVMFGVERVVDADPAFALRGMVDVAVKALSPAINDPTTAVQALDYIGALLVKLCGRELGVAQVRDRHGEVRLVHRSTEWLGYLSLGVDEIRYYGADSVQVIRRLRALYTDLLRTCPEPRTPAVRERLAAIDEATPDALSVGLDRAVAAGVDWQGLGGATAPATHG